jgi:hypothetical protein
VVTEFDLGFTPLLLRPIIAEIDECVARSCKPASSSYTSLPRGASPVGEQAGLPAASIAAAASATPPHPYLTRALFAPLMGIVLHRLEASIWSDYTLSSSGHPDGYRASLQTSRTRCLQRYTRAVARAQIECRPVLVKQLWAVNAVMHGAYSVDDASLPAVTSTVGSQARTSPSSHSTFS